jgi:uroporphyrinogen decarboxylase
MTRHERVLNALSFKKVDKLPKDLGGMNSSGISAFAYPKLVQALGLPPRKTRVHDSSQMLALPDLDVLDALDCDVIHSETGMSNAFAQPELWLPCTFGGRLDALVRNPEEFVSLPDGTVGHKPSWSSEVVSRMVPQSFVFDSLHAGQPLDLEGENFRPDLVKMKKDFKEWLFKDKDIVAMRKHLKQVRESTDRAVMFNGFRMGFGFPGGIASWSMLCLMDPDFVEEYHALVADFFCAQAKLLLPEIKDCFDVFMADSNDLGIQTGTILPPEVFHALYVPYYRKCNDMFHTLAPAAKSFLHCCGGVYTLLDSLIQAGFDVLNPVQWNAGGQSYTAWKDKCRNKLGLWGGGVNSQATLPLGTVSEVRDEVRQVVSCLSKDRGYIFCCVHNILAEIDPQKVMAMYQEAGRF